MENLGPLVDRMVAHGPETPDAEELQHAIEGALMGALATGGRSAGEALVQSLEAHGYVLDRLNSLPCMWKVAMPRPVVLELWFTGGDDPVVAAVSYRVGTADAKKQQMSVVKLQAEFYSRYERLCSTDFAESFSKHGDRLIFFVAEFEADVNNGGFGQYVENKGVARATELLTYLKTVKAKRTAEWLSSALDADMDSPQHEELDRQFYEEPEDLASLVMRYLRNRAK